jgi:O-antigen/teichoic acid export membrane protein
VTGVASVRERFGPALYLGGGLALVGAAGYAFVALTGHTLPPADAAAAASLYLLVNIIGPGLFVALEQETSRSVSAEIAADRDPRQVTRHAWLLAAVLLVAVSVLLLAISPVLTGTALGGRWGLFAAVLLSVATSAAVYVVRGLVGGRQRFTGYAATLGAEGLSRILPCVALAAAGVRDVVAYAVAFAAGSAFGALAGLGWLRRPVTVGGGVAGVRPVSVRRMARGLTFLVGGTLLMLVVMNLAPVVVTPRLTAAGPDHAAAASAFAAAFVLARVPLFLFAPVQAVLLPKLTRAATRGELATVRTTLRTILGAVAAIGLPGVLASFTVGPWAVQVLFGAQVRLPHAVVGLLGAGTVGLMVGQVLQPGLIALGRHRTVTLAWLAGTVALGVLLALPGDPMRAGVIGQLTASAVVVTIMVTALYQAFRATPPARPAEVASRVSGDRNVI